MSSRHLLDWHHLHRALARASWRVSIEDPDGVEWYAAVAYGPHDARQVWARAVQRVDATDPARKLPLDTARWAGFQPVIRGCRFRIQPSPTPRMSTGQRGLVNAHTRAHQHQEDQ